MLPSQPIKCHNCRINQLCLPVMLATAEIDHLDNIVQRKKPLNKGMQLYAVGDSFTHIHAIRTGVIKSYTISQTGERQITGFHMPGEIVGFDAINTGQHNGFAEALTSAQICSIPYSELDDLCAFIPNLRKQLAKVMSQEISEKHELMLMLNQKTADEKLAAFLINLSAREAQGKGLEKQLTLAMTRSDIANYLGLALETVSRILSKFSKKNIIALDRSNLEILDQQKLSLLAGTSCHF